MICIIECTLQKCNTQLIWNNFSDEKKYFEFTTIYIQKCKNIQKGACKQLKIDLNNYLDSFTFNLSLFKSRKRLWRETASLVWKLLLFSQSNSKRKGGNKNKCYSVIGKFRDHDNGNNYLVDVFTCSVESHSYPGNSSWIQVRDSVIV